MLTEGCFLHKEAPVQRWYITERQQEILRTLGNAPTAPSRLRQRASLILLTFDGLDNPDIADRVGLARRQVGRWRRRWANAWDRLIRSPVEMCAGTPLGNKLNSPGDHRGWRTKFLDSVLFRSSASIPAPRCDGPLSRSSPISPGAVLPASSLPSRQQFPDSHFARKNKGIQKTLFANSCTVYLLPDWSPTREITGDFEYATLLTLLNTSGNCCRAGHPDLSRRLRAPRAVRPADHLLDGP